MNMGLYCLQVGHGLCLILCFPDGRAWIFDCGGERRVIQDFLRNYVKRIEHIFLTHTHGDHVRNLEWICRTRRINTVWLPAVTPSVPRNCAKSLVRATQEKTVGRIRTAVVDQDEDSIRLLEEWQGKPEDSRLLTELLYPTALDSLLGQSDQGDLDGLCSGENVFSCMYRILYAGKRILVPGDVDMSALQRFSESYPDRLKCDLLIAPHHGRPQNVRAEGFSFEDLAATFGSDVAFVSNSSTANENWPPDANFIRAMATSGTTVVCAELTPTCRCRRAVKGPFGPRAREMGLSNGDRDTRACIGTLRVALKEGNLEYVDLQRHQKNLRDTPLLARVAPCLDSEA